MVDGRRETAAMPGALGGQGTEESNVKYLVQLSVQQ